MNTSRGKFRRLLRRILRGLLGILGVLGLLGLFLALSLFLAPSWLINDRSLQWAAKNFAQPRGLHWRQGSVSAESLSPMRKRIFLELTHPCLDTQPDSPLRTIRSLRIRGCAAALSADFTLNLSALWNFKKQSSILETIHLLAVHQGRIIVQNLEPQRRQKAGTTTRKGFSPPSLPRWLKYTRIERVLLELKDWKFYPSTHSAENFHGNFTLASNPAPDFFIWKMELHEYSQRIQVAARLHPSSAGSLDQLTYSAQLRWQPKPRARKSSLAFQADGQASFSRIEGRLRGSVQNTIPLLPQLNFEDCRYLLVRPSFSIQRLELHCPLLAQPQLPQQKTLQIALRMRNQNPMRAQLSAELERSSEESPDLRGKIRLHLDPVQTYSAILQGELDARITGQSQNLQKTWQANGSLQTSIQVPDFKRIVGLLNDTEWAVPAPFRALQGGLELHSSKVGDLTQLNFPLTLRTRLTSPSQKFLTESHGSIDFSDSRGNSPGLVLETRLSDVKLVLPRLRFEQLPQVIPDPRIRPFQAPPSETAPNHWNYSLKFMTPPEHPVRLISNLAKTEVPLHLALSLHSQNTSTEMTGQLHTGKFPLELFNRNAEIERLLIGFTPLEGPTAKNSRVEHPVDGVIRVQYTDYTVRILLNGTLEKPKITLTSTPPLPQDKLFSVLLFGQPLETLDPQQATSIGDVSAAMANGAINFISLYLLASTPIQSVGYDPRTGVFTAKLRLGEGTSLNIGADPGELQRIEIQKRLGRFWTIVTEFNDPTAPERRSLQAFLEWSNRY